MFIIIVVVVVVVEDSQDFTSLVFIDVFVLFSFSDRVSLCSPGCPGTHSIHQAGLELRNPPASASQLLGLHHHCLALVLFL